VKSRAWLRANLATACSGCRQRSYARLGPVGAVGVAFSPMPARAWLISVTVLAWTSALADAISPGDCAMMRDQIGRARTAILEPAADGKPRLLSGDSLGGTWGSGSIGSLAIPLAIEFNARVRLSDLRRKGDPGTTVLVTFPVAMRPLISADLETKENVTLTNKTQGSALQTLRGVESRLRLHGCK
jgi:hypothetical protein